MEIDSSWFAERAVYFWTAVGLWVFNTLRVLVLPLPRTFAMGVTIAYFSLLTALLGLTTFMARALYYVDKRTGQVEDTVDWNYADYMAQCLILLQMLLWSVIRHAVEKPYTWLQWALLPLILAIFYPLLVAEWPLLHTLFLALTPACIFAAMFFRETRDRRCGLVTAAVLAAGHGVAVVFFGVSDNRTGIMFVRFSYVGLCAFWFDFWAQSAQQYMQWGNPCRCRSTQETQ
jgi:hypothetical protein